MNKRSGYSHVNKAPRIGGPCACGCGETVSQPPGSGRPRRFITGHHRSPKTGGPCACGCGEMTVRVNKKGPVPKFLPGHPLEKTDETATSGI